MVAAKWANNIFFLKQLEIFPKNKRPPGCGNEMFPLLV
jgi:hypothetical protein